MRFTLALAGSASAYAPENTVPAFRLAAEQRAPFVELDLRLTKDRQLICCTTTRWNGPRPVAINESTAHRRLRRQYFGLTDNSDSTSNTSSSNVAMTTYRASAAARAGWRVRVVPRRLQQ